MAPGVRSDPGMASGAPSLVTYTAPELGYPTHPCRVCGQRPCIVQLAWRDPGAVVGRGASRRVYFCVVHLADAHRAHRRLVAGEIPPELTPRRRRTSPPRRRPDRGAGG